MNINFTSAVGRFLMSYRYWERNSALVRYLPKYSGTWFILLKKIYKYGKYGTVSVFCIHINLNPHKGFWRCLRCLRSIAYSLLTTQFKEKTVNLQRKLIKHDRLCVNT